MKGITPTAVPNHISQPISTGPGTYVPAATAAVTSAAAAELAELGSACS